MKNTLDLTKQLVEIPSFVDGNVNEEKIGEFIYCYLKKFPWLTVEKQEVENGRFNVIAYDKYPTQIIICDHIDTVQPQSGWNTNPFKPSIMDGKLFGLGTSDSKGNVATVLAAIEKSGLTKGLMILLYIDEEYDFLGAGIFIGKYKGKIRPRIIASTDGSKQKLGNSCRGLIEIIFTVEGQSGHAANPESGKNAITLSLSALKKLESALKKYETKNLGKVTTNLAWINGGQNIGTQALGKQGNVIPNFAQFGYEIRNPNTKLNAEIVIDLFRNETEKLGLTLKSFEVKHDLGAWETDRKDLKSIEKLLSKVKYEQAKNRGYVDLQMFWESFDKPTCFTYGIGDNTGHTQNEYVTINNLEKGVKFWDSFIRENC